MISIIIPVYNSEHTILETLESIKNQSFSQYECIIIDDNSNDRSKDNIRSFIYDDNRFLLIENSSNKGVSNSRNIGLSISKYDYILFIDSDDIISPNYLEISINKFLNNNKLYCIVPKIEFINDKNLYWNIPTVYSIKDILKRNIFPISIIFKKINEIYFQDNMSSGNEDWDFWIKYFGSLNQFYLPYEVNDEIIWFYRESNDSRSAILNQTDEYEKMCFQLIVNNLNLYKKYYNFSFKHLFNPGIKNTFMKLIYLINEKIR